MVYESSILSNIFIIKKKIDNYIICQLQITMEPPVHAEYHPPAPSAPFESSEPPAPHEPPAHVEDNLCPNCYVLAKVNQSHLNKMDDLQDRYDILVESNAILIIIYGHVYVKKINNSLK
jgi:hypothetical protein